MIGRLRRAQVVCAEVDGDVEETVTFECNLGDVENLPRQPLGIVDGFGDAGCGLCGIATRRTIRECRSERVQGLNKHL